MDGLTLCHSVLQAMAFQRMRKRRERSFSCLTRLGWQQWKACDKYWQIMWDLARLFGSGHHRTDEVGETWCDIHELPETQQRLARSTQKCDTNSISVWEIALPDQSPPPVFFPCILCLLFIFFPGTEVSRFLFTCALRVLVIFFPSVLLALPYSFLVLFMSPCFLFSSRILSVVFPFCIFFVSDLGHVISRLLVEEQPHFRVGDPCEKGRNQVHASEYTCAELAGSRCAAHSRHHKCHTPWLDTRGAFCSIVDHVPLKAYLPHAGWSRQQKSSMDLSSNPRTCICFWAWGCGLWSLIVMFVFVPGPGADFVQLASPRSVVFDQAENRLHAQKALMLNWPL